MERRSVKGSNFAQDMRLVGNVFLHENRLTWWLNEERKIINAPAKILETLLDHLSRGYDYASLKQELYNFGSVSSVDGFLDALLADGIIAEKAKYTVKEWIALRSPAASLNDNSSELAWRLHIEAIDEVEQGTELQHECISLLAEDNLSKRFTTRIFDEKAIDEEALTRLIVDAYGCFVCPDLSVEGGKQIYRSVPSGGGLYPIRLYWHQFHNSESRSHGLYRVRYVCNNTMRFEASDKSSPSPRRFLNEPVGVGNAWGALIIACDVTRPFQKYGNRGVIYSLLEAGHVAQCIQAFCTENDLGVFELGGFSDSIVNQSLENNDWSALVILVGKKITGKGKYPKNKDPVLSFESHWADDRFALDHSISKCAFHVSKARAFVGNEYSDWCWGKSKDSDKAYLKAISEALERFSCIQTNEVHFQRYEKNGTFLHPDEILHIPEWKYAAKDYPISRFDKDKEYPWVGAKNVLNGRRLFIPYDFCYYKHLGNDEGKLFLPNTSGVAVHNDIDEARKNALLEVMERQMFLEWWRGIRPAQKLVELEENLADVRRTIGAWREDGWTIEFLELSRDVIYTYLCIAHDESKRSIVISASSGLSTQRAIKHALMETEAIIWFSRFGERGEELPLQEVKNPQDHGQLYRNSDHASHVCKRIDETPISKYRVGIEKFEHNWIDIVKWLSASGHDVYEVDQTPEVETVVPEAQNLHSVRIIVTELMPIVFGYGLEPSTRVLPDLNKQFGAFEKHGKIAFPHPFS